MTTKHILDHLEKYMFNKENLYKIIKDTKTEVRDVKLCKKINPQVYKKKEESEKEVTEVFPFQQDKLFWCFYIMLYGKDQYNYIDQKEFTTKVDIKLKAIEKLSDYKEQIKLYKLKYEEIVNELLNEKELTIAGFIVLCIMHNISVIYTTQKKYYEINLSNVKIQHIVKVYDPSKISVQLDVYSKNVNAVIDNCIKIENIKKPILSISSYKLEDLKNMATKLGICLFNDNGKTKKKKILYEDITKCI